MVEIKEINSKSFVLENISFTDGEKVQIVADICHKFKHMYKEGYPYGRKTRKEKKERLKKWAKCPEICFAYYLTNDTPNHNLKICVLVSDEESLLKRYTKREIDYFSQMYILDVADEIIATI